MSKKKHKDRRKDNCPPFENQWKPGQSGNPNGRPRKLMKTFENELKIVFGREQSIPLDGKIQTLTTRVLILEQLARHAAKGDPRMIKLCLPFLKIMDDSPEFEIMPEERQYLKNFIKKFNNDGSIKHE